MKDHPSPENTKGNARPSREEQIKIMKKQPLLAQQNLDTLDPSKITPLSPEVISRQATINIGK